MLIKSIPSLLFSFLRHVVHEIAGWQCLLACPDLSHDPSHATRDRHVAHHLYACAMSRGLPEGAHVKHKRARCVAVILLRWCRKIQDNVKRGVCGTARKERDTTRKECSNMQKKYHSGKECF